MYIIYRYMYIIYRSACAMLSRSFLRSLKLARAALCFGSRSRISASAACGLVGSTCNTLVA